MATHEHLVRVEQPRKSLPRPGSGQCQNEEEYRRLYEQSINDPETFYREQALALLDWKHPFDKTFSGDFDSFADSPRWFVNGELNACYNAVDRHANAHPNDIALIFESDEPGQGYKVTYEELLTNVCQTALLLKSLGVEKGDVVTLYLPTIPQTIYIMLALVRLGALHSSVFAGFSPSALRDRINDASSKLVITTDQAKRAGKIIPTKDLVDKAVKDCPTVTQVLVVERTGEGGNYVEGRDVNYNQEVVKFGNYCPCTYVDSEDPMFLLYTSGSTGKPKGLQHATGGYLFGTILCSKHVFGVTRGDIFFCVADVGWITGHSHVVYGPLLNGATTVIFETTPVYPNHMRLWDIVDNHKVTQLYTAPTAIRLLRKFGEEDIKKYDLSSLRALGSVGEPIAKDVWEWFYENVGRSQCALCDTYWLTESGMILLTTLAGVSPMKPSGAGLPFFGVKPVLLDPSGNEIVERPAEGILAIRNPWPSIGRTIRGDHQRYRETYLKPFPGYFFTGDGATIDADGYVFIGGRVDDVVNVSGHRLATAEVESALIDGRIDNKSILSEAAVVGVEDALTGQALIAFVCLESWALNDKDHTTETLTEHCNACVREEIGKFAVPKKVFIVQDLPKTRSGKIMRRVLRKIVAGKNDELGELSTLSNPQIIDHLISVVQGPKARL